MGLSYQIINLNLDEWLTETSGCILLFGKKLYTYLSIKLDAGGKGWVHGGGSTIWFEIRWRLSTIDLEQKQ